MTAAKRRADKTPGGRGPVRNHPFIRTIMIMERSMGRALTRRGKQESTT